MTYRFPTKEQFSPLSLHDVRPCGWMKQQMTDDLRHFTSCIAAVAICSCGFAAEKIPAFPGAQGFGAYSRGGRGGVIVFVSTVEDYRVAGAVTHPGSHTTVRTVPYTAVHVERASRRCSSMKLTSPRRRNTTVGTA